MKTIFCRVLSESSFTMRIVVSILCFKYHIVCDCRQVKDVTFSFLTIALNDSILTLEMLNVYQLILTDF